MAMLPARMCYLLTARYHTQKVSRRIDFSTKCPACHAGSQRLRENVRCGRELLTGERSRAMCQTVDGPSAMLFGTGIEVSDNR